MNVSSFSGTCRQCPSSGCSGSSASSPSGGTCVGTRPGYAVSESLRLLAQRDPGIIRLAHWVPSNGFETTYDVIVGGAVAALATPRQPRPDS
jgi:hypothetical protein